MFFNYYFSLWKWTSYDIVFFTVRKNGTVRYVGKKHFKLVQFWNKNKQKHKYLTVTTLKKYINNCKRLIY